MSNQHYEEEMRKLSEKQSKKYWENMKQQEDKVEMITIPKEVYEDLLDDQLFLNCLESAGVDNWDGYDYAREEYREQSKSK